MSLPEIVIYEAENGEVILVDDIKLESGLNLINNLTVLIRLLSTVVRFGMLVYAVLLHQKLIGLEEDLLCL